MHFSLKDRRTNTQKYSCLQDKIKFLRADLTHLFDDQGIDQLGLCACQLVCCLYNVIVQKYCVQVSI